MTRGKEKPSEGPLVSIVCTNYNKGTWIRDAIEGFLQQETDFPYEILIIDDSSSDNSPGIIKEFAENYPDKIRAFYNTKNLGITKSWVKICKEAKGKYIARCDGDDYWTDPHKLQVQVEALEGNPGSAWANCDFDIVTPDGEVTQEAAFESGVSVRSYSYENMLATKGFTMASTWLVEAKLMLEVNDAIDENAIDDTFNIQLELFHRTELTYIPKSMVAYRVGYESDSHPVDAQKAKQRGDKLLETQIEYVDKYPEANMTQALKLAMNVNNILEAKLADIGNSLKNANQVIIDQGKVIEDKSSQLENIYSSKRYKLLTAAAHPINFLGKVRNRLR